MKIDFNTIIQALGLIENETIDVLPRLINTIFLPPDTKGHFTISHLEDNTLYANYNFTVPVPSAPEQLRVVGEFTATMEPIT